MFRKNIKHQQPALIPYGHDVSAASELPEKQRKRLENSWAGTFYKEFFSRIDEQSFAVLFLEKDSRPNVPVNVLVGLEALKTGFGWSDLELYENYCYSLQVRYALGYDRLGDGDFEIRSLCYFRERLSKYNAENRINLLEKAFEKITDAQIMDLKVHTGQCSKHLHSHRYRFGDRGYVRCKCGLHANRQQHCLRQPPATFVEALQRVERILTATDRVRLSETFAPYLKDSAGHYTYRVKGKEAQREHLQKIGQTIHWLLKRLRRRTCLSGLRAHF
jgi:hypothetical protein